MQAVLASAIGVVLVVVGFVSWLIHTPPAPAPYIEVATTTPAQQTGPQQDTQTDTQVGQSQPAQTQPQATQVATTQTVALHGSGVDLTKLPLGDNKYTTSGPKKGYVYVCHVATGGQGAMVNGPWIHGTTWDFTQKVEVQGSVSWPQAYAHITLSGSTRTIASNDLPIDHTTGTFPISRSDPAWQYDGNQSSITAQNNSVSLPSTPTMLATPDCIYGVVGVMIDGVSLNDAFDALYRDAPAHEEQDSCQGHPNNEEGYHYHSLSTCIKNTSVSSVIGWAYDGYPITGPKLPDGSELANADLDECHGITSDVVVDGKTVSTYHYVMTEDFPYSVSCFRGKSYEPKPGGGGGQTSGQMPPPGGYGLPPPR